MGGTPKWMVYNRKSYTKMDDLGVRLFQDTTDTNITDYCRKELGSSWGYSGISPTIMSNWFV